MSAANNSALDLVHPAAHDHDRRQITPRVFLSVALAAWALAMLGLARSVIVR